MSILLFYYFIEPHIMHFFLSKDLKNLKAKYISSKAAPLRREKLYFQLIFQVI